MHNNIMAAGSRDRPLMLVKGRYPQCGPYKSTTVLVQAVAATNDSLAIPEHTTIRKYGKLSKGYNKVNPSIFKIHKGKEIAKPITPPSETASEEDSDPEQAQRDKDMQKNLALISKYFKKIYKTTNKNLRTSLNSKNKNVDMTPRYKNDNQSGQFRNQRMVNVVEARENVGSLVVQQSGIQCFNCKEFGHFAKECRKPKRVKDSAYDKEKMLLCKQAEQGELEAHYSYMAKIQEVPTTDSGTDSEPLEQVQNDAGYNVFANDLKHFEQSESISNTCLVERDDSNVIPDSPNMCDDDIQNDQNDVESDDERVALANLELDVDENKKKQNQLKKANTTLARELKECKSILAETSKTLGESNSVRDSCLVAFQNKQTEFENYKLFNDRTVDMTNLNAQSEIPYLYAFPYDQSTHAIRLIPDGEETLALERESRSKLNKDLVRHDYTTLNSLYEVFKPPTQEFEIQLAHANEIRKKISISCPNCSRYEDPDSDMFDASCIKTQNDSFLFAHELKQEMHADLKCVESLEKEINELESDKAEFSNMYDTILQECVSKDVMCSYLLSLSDLDALDELHCLYLHKAKECNCLAQKLSKQTESISKKVHTELLQHFAKVEKHSISLEIAFQRT
nr:hypothetical protein [Tanacetum cinerariifolium]